MFFFCDSLALSHSPRLDPARILALVIEVLLVFPHRWEGNLEMENWKPVVNPTLVRTGGNGDVVFLSLTTFEINLLGWADSRQGRKSV